MKYFFLIATLSIFFSCEKLGLERNTTSDCVKELISEFKQKLKDGCTNGSSVKLYEFQGNEVFAFERGTCFSDFGIEIYNQECVLICTLGTLLGITECLSEEFENAEEVKTLWKG